MIVDSGTLALFALASAALIAVPGPAVLYIVTRSVQQGRRAGVAGVLGIEVGALVHVAFAAIGLSALIASSAVRSGSSRSSGRVPRRASGCGRSSHAEPRRRWGSGANAGFAGFSLRAWS